MAFTDHIPLYFLPEGKRDPKLAMGEDQFDDYLKEVESLRREFSSLIPIRLGLEADYAEGHEEALAGWLARADWDLVLGSVHWVAGDWIDAPGSAARFDREGVGPLYAEYYRLLAKAAETGLFDVLTHFDLPKKHGHRPREPLEEAIALFDGDRIEHRAATDRHEEEEAPACGAHVAHDGVDRREIGERGQSDAREQRQRRQRD